MVNAVLKFLDFMSANQKSLIVPVIITFPFIYTCLYTCMSGFDGYNIFDRAMFTFCGIFAKMYILYVPFAMFLKKTDEDVILKIMADFKPVKNKSDYKRNLFEMFGVFFTTTIIAFSCCIFSASFGFMLGVSSVIGGWNIGVILYVGIFLCIWLILYFFPRAIVIIHKAWKSNKYVKRKEHCSESEQ